MRTTLGLYCSYRFSLTSPPATHRHPAFEEDEIELIVLGGVLGAREYKCSALSFSWTSFFLLAYIVLSPRVSQLLDFYNSSRTSICVVPGRSPIIKMRRPTGSINVAVGDTNPFSITRESFKPRKVRWLTRVSIVQSRSQLVDITAGYGMHIVPPLWHWRSLSYSVPLQAVILPL